MKKYNGLLTAVAHKYSIHKGTLETEADWKTRLVYSICGMMAYASLWDNPEEGPISSTHLKRKTRSMLTNYKSLYPELSSSLPYLSEELEDEFEDLFLKTGVVYHRPNRIAPAMMREAPLNGVLFQRGIALDHISCVSGVGFYSKWDNATNQDEVKTIFGLEQKNLQALWSAMLSAAVWRNDLLFEHSTEYLRLKPPFSRGYWSNDPDKTGATSILRTGMRGAQLYYLYRCSGAALEVSPLPQWQVEAHHYRVLAYACLSHYGTLPPIEYYEDGAIVHIRMNYLLPPRELAFLKLYSWPERCTSLPCDFKRKLSTEVFNAIKDILSNEGYEFKGGTS